MEKKSDKRKNIIILILFVLLLTTVVFIGYDKILKGNRESNNINNNCPICHECENNCQNLGEKINSFKEIKLTNENQTIRIGDRQFKIKIGTYNNSYGYLFIDDFLVNNGLENVYIGDSVNRIDGRVYLTDKFLFVTLESNTGEKIQFVQGEKDEIGINNNRYQMHDFKIVNGYLHAKSTNYDSEDLIIKYIDNTLIVVSA